MTLTTHELARQLKPSGDVEQNSRFMVIVPREGFNYYPVLVHCDYKNITRATHNLVKDLVENSAPPIVVITYGNQANIGVEVASYLAANNLTSCFNSIISINNDPDAPINTIADYVINGPIEEVVPKMIKYYLNEETAEMAQKLFENNDLRVLFDAAKDATDGDGDITK